MWGLEVPPAFDGFVPYYGALPDTAGAAVSPAGTEAFSGAGPVEFRMMSGARRRMEPMGTLFSRLERA